jgi:predicted Abi (CAAX) family protease
MRRLAQLVGLRLVRSCATIPTPAQWLEVAVLAVLFALVAVPVGLASGLLTFAPTGDARLTLLGFAAVALGVPCFAEELLFRAALLPHPSEKSSRRWVAWSVAVSVSAFVLWHPFGGWLFAPWARPLFYNGVFLVLCAMFGLVASVAYLRTGSVWPCVLMHWAVVVAWKLWFGGWIMAFGQPAGVG